MKILYSWLQDFVDLKLNPEELAEKLTLAGHEVEAIEKYGEDFILDLDITPNRGDCLSHLGVAREVGAIENAKCKVKNKKQPASRGEQFKVQNNNLDIDIENYNDCPKYIARHITGVKVMPSPEWMQKRLKAMGLEPINNIVDITNYVLFELGQPMHAFDAEKLDKLNINVRRAKKGENIIALDNETYDLDKNILVIADNKGPIAIAGIMGGLETGVTNITKDIILEAAVFNPSSIRQGSKQLKISTESSYRFERGIDYEGVERAMDRVTELIVNSGGGKTKNEKRKTKNNPLREASPLRRDASPLRRDASPLRREASNLKRKINLDLKDIKRVLGVEINQEKVKSILKSLGFVIQESKIPVTCYPLPVTVPSWRHDIIIEEDLIEEIARIYRYDRIMQNAKCKMQNDKEKSKNKKQELSIYEKKEILKDVLVEMGLQEVYNYSFISSRDADILGLDKNNLWQLENPLSSEYEYLRSSLIPGLLKSVAKNPDFNSIEIFEIGNVFDKKKGERTVLGICVAKKKKRLKSIINKLFSELRITNHESGIVNIDKKILKRYKIKKPQVNVMEIEIDELLKKAKLSAQNYELPKIKHQYKEISKYPSANRDISIVVDKKIDATAVIELIKKFEPAALIAEFFDEYENVKKLGADKKSLAFHLVYQDMNKTLSDKEVDTIHDRVVSRLEKKYGARLRR